MAKSDIENAFRLIPIAPQSQHLLGFSFCGEFYYDKTLPMGLSHSCHLFERFSSALQWVSLNRLKIHSCTHILDDFLFVAPSYSNCLRDLQKFLQLADEIGLPIKEDKTLLPSTVMSFVGIELDSVRMEKRLPEDKVHKLRDTLHSIKVRKRVSLKELQSLIGLLNFACSVVTPGRAFLRRLIDLTVGVKKSHHKIRLNTEARADLAAWSIFVDGFNGISLMLPDRWESSQSLQLFTDASNIGFGGYLSNRYFAGVWPADTFWDAMHITVKELFPIVLALELWSTLLQNKCIIFNSDNEAVVHVINKQSSKDKVLMRLVRRLVMISLKCNILFQAKHVPGTNNTLADLLSRQQVPRFLETCSFPDPIPEHIPVDKLSL
ncbi:uncharacterized protein LOC128551264 [Mercenaria mercenaria]|uniref:uncharacterized protein LOC128551264 n=1 Tax=Mercenaria mercenaria TaxID=6596 RepID=UPI00234ECCEA|nr:uncharacterized protein LOC128551264 [Mercenaria mercenaria]